MEESEEQGQAGVRIARLSELAADEQADLLACYRRDVYVPSFPDPELREDPAVWLTLLAGDPGPPQPLIDLILALAPDQTVLGGATIEYYRVAECGLLTYIAVAEGRRGQGIGKCLLAEARRRLAEWAGPEAPLFAETEIYDDAETRAEREDIVLRQQRLTRLGAWMVDLDYVMPPLRPDLPPRRLHLMALDDPRPGRPLGIAAKTVVALVEELAAALGADLGAHPETAAMLDKLGGARSLRLAPLPAACFDRRFSEAPVFTDLDSTSFSFAFEISYVAADPARAQPRTAFRLRNIYKGVRSDTETFDTLVEPVRSFLDDVTMGEPGRHGRPFIFQASAARLEDSTLRLRMVRPSEWRYRAEGQVTELAGPGGEPASIGLAFQDSFCLFGSGRLFYVLTLTQAPEAPSPLDEYAVVQLELLAADPERNADNAAFLGFAGTNDAGPLSLVQFAEARLRALETSVGRPNGVADILRKHEIQRAGEVRAPLQAGALRSLCVAIDSGALAELVAAAEAAGPDGNLVDPHPPSAPAHPGSAPPPHWEEESDPEIRRFLALAGIAQGVADFPFQDLSEIYDSTRPTSGSVEAALFAHPRFAIEIATDWRSRTIARSCIGTCPYLLLMWIVAVHDEAVVGAMEEEIDRMIFGPADTGGGRAIPLAHVEAVLDQAGDWLSAKGRGPLKAILKRRLDLFRWHSIMRSDHLFRYPKERTALAEIQEAMGTLERFRSAQEKAGQIEALVEDVVELKSSYAERRTNVMLFIIAVLSVVSMSHDLQGGGRSPIFWSILLATLVLIAAVALLIDRWVKRGESDQESRSRKSS